jgi:membrane protein
LAHLQAQKSQSAKGSSAHDLAQQLLVAPAEMATVLEVLQGLDWIGSLREGQGPLHSRYVLLVDLHETLAEPLLERLLVSRPTPQDPLWSQAGLAQLRLAQLV